MALPPMHGQGYYVAIVDGSGAQITSFGGGTQYAEDAAHSSGATGTLSLAVRKDTATALADTDGDYIPLIVDSSGRLHVNMGNALPAGTNAIGKLAANSGVDIGDVDVTSIAAGDNNIGNVDIVTVPADPFGADADAASATGSISAKLRFIASTGIPITGTVTVGSHAVTNAGTFAVQESGGVLTALQIMDDWDNAASDGASVSGDVAHDAVDAGEPVKAGAQARTTNPTAVADADRVNLIADKLGKLIVVGAIRELKGVQKTTITSSTSETTIVTAVASTFLDLYGLIIANSSATATEVTIKDATAGTTRAIIAVPAGETRGFMLPVDSAVPQAASNNSWTATCADSVASIEISALYVKNI